VVLEADNALDIARDAVRNRSWASAVAAFEEADTSEPLLGPDLLLLADAAWWAGDPDLSTETLERAFAAYVEANMPEQAARVAAALAYFAFRRLAFSVARGWRAQAGRLLEGLPESGVNAVVTVLDIAWALLGEGDAAGAIEIADEAIAIARRHGESDSENEALAFKGGALISLGRWQEGLALLDEATAAALSGGVSLRSASNVYSVTMDSCLNMADFRRAGEWTEEADRWMSRHSVGGYPGMCRVHRAELKRLRGSWSEAESEALSACEELERYRILDGAGMARYEVGEIRLLMGDLVGADEAFQLAFEIGYEPQPGLSLLRLAQGRRDEAAKGLQRTLASSAGNDVLTRARLLPAMVEVALEVDDLGAAKAASAELDDLAAQFDRPAFGAVAGVAKARVELHQGRPEAAIPHLELALRVWRDVEFPFEAARVRLLLGRSHLAQGDTVRARMELDAARSTFEGLGAAPALAEVDELIASIDRRATELDRAVRTFMFTDIVTSTDLITVIGDEAWAALLAWHDRELRSVFGDHGGVEVNHAGDGFFVVFDSPLLAVDAAVAIQRRLADHRREHGFSPAVRIGIHTAEATVDGAEYRGHGVHVAARVGSEAGGEEITISEAALGEAGSLPHPVSPGVATQLKGVADPVVIHKVEWR
jgi:class 3 adenylate cyclase